MPSRNSLGEVGFVRSILFLAILLILAGVCLASEPDDSTGVETSDSTLVEAADSLGAADRIEETPDDDRGDRSGKRKAEETSWFWNTHPKYEVGISKKKDVTNWDTKIGLKKKLSDRVSLTLNASLHTRENSTLNRSDSNDGTSANLKYRLNEAISFNLTYNAKVNAYRFGLEGGEPQDRKKKEDITISSQLSKTLADGVDLTVKTTAGATENSYASVSNKGNRQDLTASISYAPSETFSASVNYTGKRLNLDSSIDSSGVTVFTSKDLTFSQNLNLAISYDVVPGLGLRFNSARSDHEKQHPETVSKQQETENRTSRRASVSSSFRFYERLTWDVSVDFSDSETQFAVQDGKNNASQSSALSASAKLLPWRAATVNLAGEREISRSEYTTDDSGRDLHKFITFKLTQGLGERADMSLNASTDMISVFYDDKEANPKDRDRVSNRVGMDFNFKPRSKISTRVGGEFSEDRTVYIKSESSANNRTTRKYRVSGSYNVTTYRSIGVAQNYDISAVYTYYHFGESKNTLVRNSNLQTRFTVPVTRAVKLNMSHNYKFQDQGSYSEEGNRRLYSRAEESESHVFNIGLNYKVFDGLKVVVRQSYYIQRSWEFDRGEKELDFEVTSTDIVGKMEFNYTIGEKTRVSLSVEQNRKEGTRVNEDFKSYRNIEFEASRVF
jgi:hypothetical protein